MKVYLTYVTTDWSQSMQLFRKEEDAESYIRQEAKRLMINMEKDLMLLECRDYNKRLCLDIMYRDEDDPEYERYAELHVTERKLK